MKKVWFKTLCLVLVIALLAPNAFAATAQPEAPLADAATVARVQQEIASGQITDMEDLFLVAYQHLGADINEDGMTVYINEDGTLGITQIIENDNSDVSVYSLTSGVAEKTIAVMSIGLFDDNGNIIPASVSYETKSFYASNSDDEGIVCATLSVYITAEYVDLYRPYPTTVGFDYMQTTIIHTLPGYVSSELVQQYVVYDSFYPNPAEQGSQTTYWPATGTHTYHPSGTDLYGYTSGTPGGKIQAFAELTVTNISTPIYLGVVVPFASLESYGDLTK